MHKSVFIIFFQGDQLKNRVKKICEGYESLTAGQVSIILNTLTLLYIDVSQFPVSQWLQEHI